MTDNMILELISVIIPVYNSEKYLKRCLESVIGQNYRNIEVILVDDGSTDNSGRICDEYAQLHSNFFVFHKMNGGASMARKYGLEKANGVYVTFIDSDDWVAHDYISKLYELTKQYDIHVCACAVRRLKTGEGNHTYYKEFHSSILNFEMLMPRFFKYEFWGFWGKLYLKSCLDNLIFPVATLSEDYYVMTQLFKNERKIVYLEEPLYFFEYHENSLSHQNLSKRSFEEFDNVKAVYEYSAINFPQYKDYALSNVVETCVKLYAMAKDKNCRALHEDNFASLSTFLHNHVREIVFCKPLNNKTRILSLLLLVSPKVFISLIQ